jgi:hypothetical protein
MSLADILQYLAPPQQDYERLALELSRYTAADMLEQVVRTYFEIFANGYDFWQANYDYPRVHEYFYGAYLRVADLIPVDNESVDLGSVTAKNLVDFFECLSLALLHNTRCENAMLCNVTNDLLIHAEIARDYAQKAIAILEEEIWRDLPEQHIAVFEHIKRFININLKLYHGYAECAQLYLLRWSAKPEALDKIDSLRATVSSWLDRLRPESRELSSELRTQYISATRLLQDYQDRGKTSLVIKQADLILRATAYAGPHLTEPIFDLFDDKAGGPNVLLDKLKTITGLSATDVRTGGFMDDSMETVLAERICNRLVFDFPAGDATGGITIHAFDGPEVRDLAAEEISIEISKQGNVTLKMKFCLGAPGPDVSMSYVRFMNALLSPHTGTLNITWYGNESSNLSADAVNYVADYLACKTWYEHAQNMGALPQAELSHLSGISTRLDLLKEGLRALTDELRNPAIEDPHLVAQAGKRDTPHVSLTALQVALELYEPLRAKFQDWEWLQNEFPENGTPDERTTWEMGRSVFPPKEALHYIRLIDICKEILGIEDERESAEEDDSAPSATTRRGFKGFLEQIASEAKDRTAPVQYDNWQYDPNLGWQAILVVNRLAKRTLTPTGFTELEPISAVEQAEILEHPEFKGLVIGRQEVGGMDDWMYAVDPREGIQPPFTTTTQPALLRNLAYVRSHDGDVVYVGPNNVCLYMINNPQFLVDVTIDMIRMIGDVRGLVMAYHMNTRQVVEALVNLLDDQAPKAEIMKFKQESLRWRREMIMFFELIRDLPISRYQDHGDLMREMLKDSGINDWLHQLSHSVSTLDQLLRITQEME